MRALRLLKGSKLSRNIFAVASGTAAGQAVTFAFSPLITRIYSPEIFGLQGVFLALVSILTPVIALRYPMAIVVADDDDEADQIAKLALCISFALSLLLGASLLIVQEQVSVLFGAEALGSLIWFLPLALLCVAAQDVANFRAARQSRFRQVGIVNVVQAVVANLVRVIGGLAAPVAAVLVAVTSLAPGIQAALLNYGERRTGTNAVSLTKRDILVLLKRYRDFPTFRTPTDVLNSASQSVPVILLATLFSPAAAGLYTLTRSVLNLPANLINAAVGNVLYARFAELARASEPLVPLLARATFLLLSLAPLIVGAAWFAPDVFSVVFGEEWEEAGEYARWMSAWVAMMIANVPSTRIVPVINRQGLLMFFNAFLLIVRIAAVLITYWATDSALAAVAWFSVSSAVTIAGSILLFSWLAILFDRRERAVNHE